MATILGIESSCDDTSAAICINGKVINNEVAGQEIHKSYGGVVPELASRAHHKNIVPLVDHVLRSAGLSNKDLDAISYTRGPGLLGALLVGASFSKSLAAALKIPTVPVNHMRAHILAHFIDDPKPKFPFLCLTVSGGHTQLVLVKSMDDMTIVGHTIDDAVGEAFDKIGKMLGLSYPAGPILDKLAHKGNSEVFTFSKSKINGLDYSFSGIKTSVMYFLQKELQKDVNFIQNNLSDLCASVQKTLIDMLMEKFIIAAQQLKINELAIAGGVSANSELRNRLISLGKKNHFQVFIPAFEYCTDNAGMVAKAGSILYEQGIIGDLTDSPLPRMEF